MNRIVTVIFLFAFVSAGCGVCSEDKLAETPSPSAKYVGVVYRRGCGATSGFLYHVNLRTSDDSFSADMRGVIEDGQVFLTREGKVTINWKDENSLEIVCNGCPTDREPTMLSSWKDVMVSYQLH